MQDDYENKIDILTDEFENRIDSLEDKLDEAEKKIDVLTAVLNENTKKKAKVLGPHDDVTVREVLYEAIPKEYLHKKNGEIIEERYLLSVMSYDMRGMCIKKKFFFI